MRPTLMPSSAAASATLDSCARNGSRCRLLLRSLRNWAHACSLTSFSLPTGRSYHSGTHLKTEPSRCYLYAARGNRQGKGGRMNIITARLLALVLSGILVVTGCGAGGSDSPLPGNPPPTGDSPFSGRLIAEGTAQVHTMNLSMAGDWTVRLGSSVYEVITVHRPGNELLVANASFGSPLTVASYDLSNFTLSGTFVWPDSEDRDYGRVHGVALSPDGKHLAAVISGVGDPFLEIVDRGTKEVRFSGRLGMAGNQLHWLSDDLLALVANISDPANNLAGAFVTVSLAELASGSSEINMNLLVKFTPD